MKVSYFSVLTGLLWVGVGYMEPGALAAGIENFGKRTPSTEEFIRALTPQSDKPRTRGLKPIGLAPEALSTVASEEPVGAAMELKFEFNSVRLSTEAEQTLGRLGEAMQAEQLQNYAFRIEGHTDSIGNAVYNQRLSERRAEAVKRYLVERFHVEPERLQTVGRGEEAPLHPEHPEHPENRRVQVVTLER